MTFNEHINTFKKHLLSIGRSKATIMAYEKDLSQLNKFIKKKKLEEISENDIKNFLDYIIDTRKYAKKTASRKLNSINTFCKYLVETKKLKRNFAQNVEHPQIEQKPPQILSTVEYKAIRDTAKTNLRLQTIIELLLQTGIRIGEISRLRIGDIKIDSSPPHIFVKENQSSSSRIVELNEVALKTLDKYLQTRMQSKNDKGYVFKTRTGRRMLPRNIRTALSRVFANAGVNGSKVNDLRNTFICHQIESGMDLKRLGQIVGHKRKTSTEKYLQITKRKTPGTVTEIAIL